MGIKTFLINMFLNRLYCLNELLDYDKQIHEKYKLGNVIASHDCGHRYRTKAGGIKETIILHNKAQKGNLSHKTCSVCFKMYTNVHENISTDIIDSVCRQEGTERPTIEFLKNKNLFYQWLYKHVFLS
jgi:hypothetical protein